LFTRGKKKLRKEIIVSKNNYKYNPSLDSITSSFERWVFEAKPLCIIHNYYQKLTG
jgi:hypothetical protein